MPAMTRARLKTEVQDVWQYRNNRIAAPRWVIACTVINGQREVYLVRGADKQRIEYGDYLVRDLDGAPLWMTAADFRRDYEVVE
jgi:hypothetical protein